MGSQGRCLFGVDKLARSMTLLQDREVVQSVQYYFDRLLSKEIRMKTHGKTMRSRQRRAGDLNPVGFET